MRRIRAQPQLDEVLHAASTAIATIIAATAASIMPRRPMRATMELSPLSMAIVPAAKIAKTTVIVSAER